MLRIDRSPAAAAADAAQRAPWLGCAANAGAAPSPGPWPSSTYDAVAFDARLVRNHRAQVHDDAGAAVGFGGQDRRQRADVGVLATRLERERRVRQIQRDSRGIVDRERHRLRSRAAQAQPQLDLLPRQRLNVDGLEAQRVLRGHDGRQEADREKPAEARA